MDRCVRGYRDGVEIARERMKKKERDKIRGGKRERGGEVGG